MVTLTAVARESYPTSLGFALLCVRVFLGLMIFTHGYRKAFRGGKIEGTARWFDSIGMKPGRLNAYAAASTELGVGVLLTLGFLTPLASAALIALMIVALLTVHVKNGFMITNPGGGMEYCLGIAVMALAVGTAGAGRYSLDYELGFLPKWSDTTNLLVTAIVGAVGAILQLTLFFRPKSHI